LYCINRAGEIFAADLVNSTADRLCQLPLKEEEGIPIHALCGAAGMLFVAVSRCAGEQGTGTGSEVWCVSQDSGEVHRKLKLRLAAMNFAVTPDGSTLVAAAPWDRTVFAIGCDSGRELWRVANLGRTPAEVIVAG
jgi:hypothetical protein